MLSQMWCFATIWSVGTTTNLPGRMKFDVYMRAKMKKIGITFPEEKLVHDYQFDIVKKEWIPWFDTIKPFSVDTDEVEPVEALVDPSKIRPGCECLILFPWLCKAFQTHQASAFNGVVVIRKYFPECLEHVEHQPTLIILYFFIE